MNKKPFRHIGLFEGIGGFSLAGRWMGWETVAWCEWNPFGQKVLRHHFPEAIGHGDITKTDFTPYANTIDILTGGFPCQPFSLAGDQEGSEDDRYLFPEMLRAIREVKPRWIVAENVYGITTPKFKGVFEEIYTSLASEGYSIQTYIVPASAVNAPHERYRVWFVAHANRHADPNRLDPGANRSQTEGSGAEADREVWQADQRQCLRVEFGDNGNQRAATNTGSTGREKFNPASLAGGAQQCSGFSFEQWDNWPTVSPVCNGNDGIPAGLDTGAFSFANWRNESIKAGGNAIVPQVAYQIFKAIQQYESL